MDLGSIDRSIFRLLNHGLGDLAGPVLDPVMLFFSDRWPWIILAAAVVVFGVWRRDRRLVGFCLSLGLTLGVVDVLTYQVLKPTFQRPRPCYQMPDVRLVPERCGSDFGFPSNHAANSMATAVALALSFRRRVGVAAVAFASIIGLSRIYLGVHFPADVAAGFLFGGAVALVMHFTVGRLAKHWVQPQS